MAKEEQDLTTQLKSGNLTPELGLAASILIKRLRTRVGWMVKMIGQVDASIEAEGATPSLVWRLRKHLLGVERARKRESQAFVAERNELRLKLAEATWALGRARVRIVDLEMKQLPMYALNDGSISVPAEPTL